MRMDIDDRYILAGVQRETDPKKLAELEKKAEKLREKMKRLMEKKSVQ